MLSVNGLPVLSQKLRSQLVIPRNCNPRRIDGSIGALNLLMEACQVETYLLAIMMHVAIGTELC